MTCTVIPALRLPRGMDFFTYAIPPEHEEHVRPGVYVSIPFRNKRCIGLVIAIDSVSEKKRSLKPIEKVHDIVHENIEEVKKIVQWFSDTYFCSQPLALKTLIPEFPKTFADGKERKPKTKGKHTVHEMLWEIEELSREETGLPRTDKSLITIPSSLQEAYTQHCACIKKIVHDGGTCVILFPTVHDCELFFPVAQKMCAENSVELFHSDMPVGARFHVWHKTFSPEPLCIIGTRTALSLSCQNLKGIIIDQSHRIEHCNHDMNPRYDARSVAKKIAHLVHVPLVLSSCSPRIEDIFDNNISIQQTPRNQKISIVNLSDNWRGGSYEWVSAQLAQKMQLTLDAGRGVFLFLNKKGSGSAFVCRDCGSLSLCPMCQDMLKPSDERALLFCKQCRSSIPIPAQCNTCGSVRLASIGVGIEKVADWVRKHFPTKNCLAMSSEKNADNPLVAADSIHSSLQWMHSEKGRNEHALTQSIIIGTSYALSAYPELFRSMGICGVIHADPVLQTLNFRAEESQQQTLSSLMFICQSFEVPIVLQTFNPESEFIQSLISNDSEHSISSHSVARQKIGWPPFGLVLSLMYRPPYSSRAEKTSNVFQNVSATLKHLENKKIIRILSERRGTGFQKNVYEIIIHISHIREIPEPLRILIQSLSQEWLIDRDPDLH